MVPLKKSLIIAPGSPLKSVLVDEKKQKKKGEREEVTWRGGSEEEDGNDLEEVL